MTEKKNWNDLSVENQTTLIRQFDDDSLSKNYDMTKDDFQEIRKYLENIPDSSEAERKERIPPKSGILSARRDLSFKEANFELIDNSLDKWVNEGKGRDLEIRIDYNIDLLKGEFTDNAGGFAPEDVYKVFIPGETGNEDYSKAVIGSFGMGAKKALFRLSSGISVVSSQSSELDGAYCQVPEKWEFTPKWDTFEGTCKSIGEGITRITFGRLHEPPDESEIEALKEEVAKVYAPVLSGFEFIEINSVVNDKEIEVDKDEKSAKVGNPKLSIWVCGEEIKAAPQIELAAVPGAFPRIYSFSQEFKNPILADPESSPKVKINFKLLVGLKKNLSGDFGVDVFGNGRLFDEFLKEQFGFGTRLAPTTTANKYLRGFLYMTGHSVVIPWDTHKREYQSSTEVAEWLKNNLNKIVSSYCKVSQFLAQSGKTALRKESFETEELPSDFEPEVFTDLTKRPAKTEIKKRWDEIKPEDEEPPEDEDPPEDEEPPEDDDPPEDEEPPEVEEPPEDDDPPDDDEVISVQIDFDAIDADTLFSRLDADNEEDLAAAIKQSLLQGVYFPMKGDSFKKACEKFDVAEDSAELSLAVYQALMESLVDDKK